MKTVSTESEIYYAIRAGNVFRVASGVYNMYDFVKKQKKNRRLTYRKKNWKEKLTGYLKNVNKK